MASSLSSGDGRILTLSYVGGNPDGLSLGVDTGLNDKLLRALLAQHTRAEPFQAHVYCAHDLVLRGHWGYCLDAHGAEQTDRMKSLGWNDTHLNHARDVSARISPTLDRICFDGPVINTLWPGIVTYGHWILDTIPRLTLLKRTGIDFDNCIALLPENPTFYMREILATFGITAFHAVGWNQEVKCKEIYASGHCRSTVAFPRELYDEAFELFRRKMNERFAGPVAGTLPRRYVVRHTPLTSATVDPRGLVDEGAIEKRITTSCGFSLLDPMKFPFTEQFCIFQDSQALLGIDSSALHNAIFARRGTFRELIVLCPPWRFNYNHYLVAAMTGARLTLVAGVETSTPNQFRVDADRLVDVVVSG